MGIRPRLSLVMGIDDLQVTKQGDIVDPRLAIPAHAPADMVAHYGVMWWRMFPYGDDVPEARVRLPHVDVSVSARSRMADYALAMHAIRSGLTERPEPLGDRIGGRVGRLLVDHFPTSPADPTARAELGERLVALLDEVGAFPEPAPHPLGRRYDELIHWSVEGGPQNVIGVEVGGGNTYDQEWLWALCVDQGDDWMQPGYRALRSLRLEDDQSLDARYLRITHLIRRGLVAPRPGAKRASLRQIRDAAARKRRLLRNGWNIPSLTWQAEGWGDFAGYALRQIGLQTRAADRKLMLVWTWS